MSGYKYGKQVGGGSGADAVARAGVSALTQQLAETAKLDDASVSVTKVWSSQKTQAQIELIPKGATGERGLPGTASVAIDDTVTSVEQTWSSTKIQTIVNQTTSIVGDTEITYVDGKVTRTQETKNGEIIRESDLYYEDGKLMYTIQADNVTNKSVRQDLVYNIAGSLIAVNMVEVVFIENVSALTATPSKDSVALTWVAGASAGVTGYEVFVNGIYAGETASTSYTAINLSEGTIQNITVKSKDANGNTSSGAIVSTTTLRSDHALQFNGTNSYATIPHADALNASAFTLEVDVYLSETNYNGAILTKNSGTASAIQSPFTITTSTGRIYAHMGDGVSYDSLSDATTPINVWTRYAFTYDGIAIKLYKNGVLLGSKSTVRVPLQNTSPVSFGRALTANYFRDKLNNVRMYDRALSVEEILGNYNGSVNRSGLVGEWLLDEGVGSVIKDTSGNGHNGTTTNTTWLKV